MIDNGSTDASAEAAEQAGARAIRMGSNAGFARAVNRGIAECGTEYVALVNNDIEAAPDWLSQLAAALHAGRSRTPKRDGRGAAGVRVHQLQPDG